METINLNDQVSLTMDLESAMPGIADGVVNLSSGSSVMTVPFQYVAQTEEFTVDRTQLKATIQRELQAKGYNLTVVNCLLPM